MARTGNPDWHVLSLARGLAVIRAFTREAPFLTVTEIADHCGLSRAAARRFTLTLLHHGYVGSDGDRYFLKPMILDLGYAFVASMNVEELIQPYVDEVADQTGESSSVAVLNGSDIVFVARRPAKRFLSIAVDVGTKLPAAATAMGRVLLADLPEAEFRGWLTKAMLPTFNSATINSAAALEREMKTVRRQGWALVRGEIDETVEVIAVPIVGPTGRTIASICISTGPGKLAKENIRKGYLKSLQTAAQTIGRLLKASPLALDRC